MILPASDSHKWNWFGAVLRYSLRVQRSIGDREYLAFWAGYCCPGSTRWPLRLLSLNGGWCNRATNTVQMNIDFSWTDRLTGSIRTHPRIVPSADATLWDIVNDLKLFERLLIGESFPKSAPDRTLKRCNGIVLNDICRHSWPLEFFMGDGVIECLREREKKPVIEIFISCSWYGAKKIGEGIRSRLDEFSYVSISMGIFMLIKVLENAKFCYCSRVGGYGTLIHIFALVAIIDPPNFRTLVRSSYAWRCRFHLRKRRIKPIWFNWRRLLAVGRWA